MNYLELEYEHLYNVRDQTLLFMKLCPKTTGLTTLNSLRAKVSAVKELKDFRIVYCLFSVSGFNDGTAEDCGKDVLLFDKGEPVSASIIPSVQ